MPVDSAQITGRLLHGEPRMSGWPTQNDLVATRNDIEKLAFNQAKAIAYVLWDDNLAFGRKSGDLAHAVILRLTR